MIIVAILAFGIFATGAARAQERYCGGIKDFAQRQECLALASGRPEKCVSVPDFARRQECFARTRGQPETCNDVRDYSDRQRCKALAGR
jgi:hypothetical protein